MAEAGAQPLLALQGVRHRFDDLEVLRGIDLQMAPAEVLCLLGPSGCGKTTLLRLAAGIETLQNGRIELGGVLVGHGEKRVHLPPERRRVGMMFQDFALFPHLTVRKNILFGIREQRAGQDAWLVRVTEQMEVAGLLEQFPGTLSGGQQQRVALLRALAPHPALLLLDEPFSGLDINLRASVREQTLSLLREAGVGVLMVTHDPAEAMFMADRIAVMRDGCVEQIGAPDDIYFQPETSFVASLFGRLNTVPGVVRDGQVQTPLGPVVAGAHPDGTAVSVLIRPDAVVQSSGVGVEVEVLAAWRIGAQIEVSLQPRVAQSDVSSQPLLARWHASSTPRRGDRLSVRMDITAGVFVFAA